MKHKRNRNKTKKLSPAALQSRVLKQFIINPKKRYNAKQLIQKAKLNNNRDSVNLALKELAKKNQLVSIGEGRYKLNKAAMDDVKLGKKSNSGSKRTYT